MTFLGKTIAGESGSALRVNVSLESNDGSNAFVDPAVAEGRSTVAHQCIGGVLEHHRALDDLENGEELVEALGGELVANFVGAKRDEWQNRTAAVTEPRDSTLITPRELESYRPVV